jgi:predicted transcriptional regulator
VMGSALPHVEGNATVEEVAEHMKSAPAVLMSDQSGKLHIITKQDLIASIRK